MRIRMPLSLLASFFTYYVHSTIARGTFCISNRKENNNIRILIKKSAIINLYELHKSFKFILCRVF